MACQAASATTSLVNAQKAGPWCLVITMDPEKTSDMAWYSTRPRRGTALIWYLGVVVIPMYTNRA
jgi:hypothetical protein